MADLNIPNLNIKSEKYIFKKKLNLRRKSKRRLFTESSTINKSFLLLIDLFSNLYEIFLVIFIFASLFTALILIIGSLNRLIRVSKRKSKQISYK